MCVQAQACRTLKAQINHYEVNFQAEYGHLPRTRERAPLVSTYAQYKSWKQFIRDDASTQLQVRYFLWPSERFFFVFFVFLLE